MADKLATGVSCMHAEFTDGAVIEAAEGVRGIYTIQALNLDEALAIANQVPPPWRAVEVHPLWSETA
ncbi:MAG: hypothetical protein M3Z50_02015 [Actinomycetota bacterium]|nr:hypothetical protein [Actinomycetota bacterium]